MYTYPNFKQNSELKNSGVDKNIAWFNLKIKNVAIAKPDRPMLGGQAKTLIMENQKAKLLVDYVTPTDGKIDNRRPDVTVYIKSQRRVEVFQVAVA